MLLDASHRRFILVCLALLAVATAGYVVYVSRSLHGPQAGSWPGLIYGTAGLGLMLYAGVLGLRRKVPTWRIGRATTWMMGHLWLGLLSYALILFHAGFQLGGPLTLILMVLFTAVVASGVFGVVLQQYIPRLMLSRLPLETVYEQIDSVVRQLRAEADALVAAAGGPLPEIATPPHGIRVTDETAPVAPLLRTGSVPSATMPEAAALREIYLGEIRPYLGPQKTQAARLATAAVTASLFRHLRTVVSPTVHDTLRELEAICEERRQLADQKRLHHWLHGWLLFHVPLSMALLLLSVVHAVISLRY